MLSRAVMALLACSASLLAQSLSGRVVDQNGLPVAGITVDPGHGSNAASSNASGLFTITGLQNRS